MMAAIEVARKCPMGGKPVSKTNGLRAIRNFEKVNGMDFNPKDKLHLAKIAGAGVHEDFFRSFRLRIEGYYREDIRLEGARMRRMGFDREDCPFGEDEPQKRGDWLTGWQMGTFKNKRLR